MIVPGFVGVNWCFGEFVVAVEKERGYEARRAYVR
jgi:hypothetical protein